MVNATEEILSRLVPLHACAAKKLQFHLVGREGTLAPFDKVPFQSSHPSSFKKNNRAREWEGHHRCISGLSLTGV